MANEKIFIGPKLRELRQQRDLTQAQLAAQLGVSASYVNLVEHNQRSASVKFLVKLSEKFGLEMLELTNSDNSNQLSDLRRMSQDPAFGDAKPDVEELRAALDHSPKLVEGALKIFNAYKTFGERLAEYGEATSARDSTLSIEQGVHDFFRNNNNYFAALEECAEQCQVQEIADRHELYGALRAHLRQHLGVEVIHVQNEILGNTLCQFDSRKSQIQISDALDHTNKVFHLAHQIARIEFAELLVEQLPSFLRDNAQAAERCVTELANYFAAAMIMPYEKFHKAAIDARYDVDLLATRFSVSYEQICHRLTTLQRPGRRGIPFFFLRIDRGGNVSKRFNATPIQLARYGGACPRLDVHYCFRVPGRILTQVAEMPDHSRYLTINRTVDRPAVRYSTEDKRLALSIGCPVEYAKETVYGLDIDVNNPRTITPIGVNCRQCPRTNCLQRAHDPFHIDLQL